MALYSYGSTQLWPYVVIALYSYGPSCRASSTGTYFPRQSIVMALHSYGHNYIVMAQLNWNVLPKTIGELATAEPDDDVDVEKAAIAKQREMTARFEMAITM